MSPIDSGPEAVKSDIVGLLKAHPEGLSVQEISEELEINRGTATKYLMVLEAVGNITRRKIGSATLHYLKTGRPQKMEALRKVRKSIVEGRR